MPQHDVQPVIVRTRLDAAPGQAAWSREQVDTTWYRWSTTMPDGLVVSGIERTRTGADRAATIQQEK